MHGMIIYIYIYIYMHAYGGWENIDMAYDGMDEVGWIFLWRPVNKTVTAMVF